MNTNHGKNIVGHIINDTFADNICLVCLIELEEFHEDIFTKVCKDDGEYCVADILKNVFNVQLHDDDNYNVCPNCFIGALSVYKFYLQIQRSQEMLDFYFENVSSQINGILDGNLESDGPNMACVTVPNFEPNTHLFKLDLGSFSNSYVNNNSNDDEGECSPDRSDVEDDPNYVLKNDDEIIIVKAETEDSKFFQIDDDGNIVEISNENVMEVHESDNLNEPKKRQPYVKKSQERKKRGLMEYIKCLQCPVMYRFTSKIRDHMKAEHDIDVYICKVCKKMIHNEQEYYSHLKSHVNTFVCALCGVAFKKRKTMILHLKKHEQIKHLESNSTAHVCEICGEFQLNEEKLKEHKEDKHSKKFICFYCGRTYKGAMSLEQHIKKHETLNRNTYSCVHCNKEFNTKSTLDEHLFLNHPGGDFPCNKCKETFYTSKDLREHTKTHRDFFCEKCSRGFVDARALMWHQRLHNNERPYECKSCGRAFVSANRRNQHMTCAHTAPSRRCPMCPALFHLRSMVNSHIRKVHLQEHRRRNNRVGRAGKAREVYWRTEVVPLEELSLEVQSSLLDMQTNQ